MMSPVVCVGVFATSFFAQLASMAQAPAAAEGPQRLVSVAARDIDAAGRDFARLELDVAARTGEAFEIIADDADLASLERAGIPYELLVEDLEVFYASRLDGGRDSLGGYGAWLNPPFGQGDMGSYYTYDEIASVLDQLRAAYPGLITAKQSIGQTLEGREQWMVKISDNPDSDEAEPEVRIDSLHHAREPQSMQTTLWFMLFLLEEYGQDPLATYLVDQRELYFVPVVNPDGYVYNEQTNPNGGGLWRKNRRNNGNGTVGVDLNRNYPEKWGYDNEGSSPNGGSQTYRGSGPASEPEIANMVSFISGREFRTALSAHSYSNLWLSPYGFDYPVPPNHADYTEVSQLATEVNGYTYGPWSVELYLGNGITTDYDHNVHDCMSWTPEIGGSGDGFWPPPSRIVPLAEENLLAFQRTALAAGAFIQVSQLDQSDGGDGDGFPEQGEPVEFRATLRNSGRGATSTPVLFTLSTASQHATVTQGLHDFGMLASFSDGDNDNAPLVFEISQNAPTGAIIDFVLEISFEGWTQSFPGQVTVGQPVSFILDDAETALGWIVGAPGDTATTGIWERDVPIGTTYNGQPSNPGIDATPGAGTHCFVTGNGGGSAGNDDIDNGATTLTSPEFDLSQVGPATLSYARWFANLTQPDDDFQVQISNNGGSSWTPLETISQTANEWVRSEFLVPNVLPQTARMRLRLIGRDVGSGSLSEAAFDDLDVRIFDAVPRFNVYGATSAGATVLFTVTGDAGSTYIVVYSLDDPATNPPLGTTKFFGSLFAGAIGAERYDRVPVTVPGVAGTTFWCRAIVKSGTSYSYTNWDEVTVQ